MPIQEFNSVYKESGKNCNNLKNHGKLFPLSLINMEE